MEQQPPSPTIVVDKNLDKSTTVGDSKDLQKKTKSESYLTSGCGYGKSKKKLVGAFWAIVWPGLEKAGWRKVDVQGKDEGSVTFLPPNTSSNGTTGKRRKDYYDKIRDLVDRVLEKRNEEESKIADDLVGEIGDLVKPRPEDSAVSLSRPRRAAAIEGTRRRTRPSLTGGIPGLTGGISSGIVDLSWKDGGKSYPKHPSRVGEEYQATQIPAAGTWENSGNDSAIGTYYDMIWDPKESEKAGVVSFVDEKVPHNKKEEAFAALHANGYSISNMSDLVSKINPMDGSDWSKEEKEKFHSEIFRLRKDMRALRRVMNKDMKSCLAYYLGTYKKSDHYRLLKTVCVDERSEKAATSVHGVDACAVCGDGGSLLICDGCEGEYHMACLRPPLKTVPEGHWECDECVDRKFLNAREYIIRNTSLYEPRKASNGEKRKAEDEEQDLTVEADEIESDDVVLRPTSPVLKRMKRLAKGISEAFSRTSAVEMRID